MNQMSGNNVLRIALVTIVLSHLVIAAWHGVDHVNIPVPLSMIQNIFVGIIIILLPLVGAALLWTKYSRRAAWLITITMLASFLFGLINHFIFNSPDYVLEIPSHLHRHSFILTAALLVASEALGTVVGFIVAKQNP